jgi:hypothetical protein
VCLKSGPSWAGRANTGRWWHVLHRGPDQLQRFQFFLCSPAPFLAGSLLAASVIFSEGPRVFGRILCCWDFSVNGELPSFRAALRISDSATLRSSVAATRRSQVLILERLLSSFCRRPQANVRRKNILSPGVAFLIPSFLSQKGRVGASSG